MNKQDIFKVIVTIFIAVIAAALTLIVLDKAQVITLGKKSDVKNNTAHFHAGEEHVEHKHSANCGHAAEAKEHKHEHSASCGHAAEAKEHKHEHSASCGHEVQKAHDDHDHNHNHNHNHNHKH